MTGITIQPSGMTVDGVVAQRVYLTGSDTYYQDGRSRWFHLVDRVATLTTAPNLVESPATTMITGPQAAIVDSHRHVWRLTRGGRVSRDIGAGPVLVDEDGAIKATALYYDHGGRVHRRGTDGVAAGAPKWWYWGDEDSRWHDEVSPTASAPPPDTQGDQPDA